MPLPRGIVVGALLLLLWPRVAVEGADVRDEYLLYIGAEVSDERLEGLFPETSEDPEIRQSMNRGWGAVKCIRLLKERVVLLNVNYAAVDSLQGIFPGLVVKVEQNAEVQTAASSPLTCPVEEQGYDVPHHLRGVYQRPDDMGSKFFYDPFWGEGILAYVLDTGVDCEHKEFVGGRCRWLYNAVASEPAEDLSGHGTAVASLFAGNTLGVARRSTLLVSKCLTRSNGGTTADCAEALAAIGYYERFRKTNSATSVINLSFVVGGSSLIRDAVQDLLDLGVIVVAASGNDKIPACYRIPGAMEAVITVGNLNVRASSGDAVMAVVDKSNYGSCVTIHAPGQMVKVAAKDHFDRYIYMNGTSFSSPVVASMVVAFLSSRGGVATREEATEWLIENSISGLSGLKGSPDRIAQLPCKDKEPTRKSYEKFEENCFGNFNDVVSLAQGSIEWYGTDTAPTWQSDFRCWRIDCPSGNVEIQVTDWQLQSNSIAQPSTDYVYAYDGNGGLHETFRGPNQVGRTTTLSNTAVIMFSSIVRIFRYTDYPGFSMSYTCSVPPPGQKSVVLRVATGSNPSRQTVSVELVFADGSTHTHQFSAGNTYDTVIWTIPNAPHDVEELRAVHLTSVSNGHDAWHIERFDVYIPGSIGFQALGVDGSSILSATLSSSNPVTYMEAAEPTNAPATQAPPTSAPPTWAPTGAPPTAAPPTVAPPTVAPPTVAPPTVAPPTVAPPTVAPPTVAPPTEAPPTEAPPTHAPDTEAPETEAPATEAPPTNAPDTEAPATKAPATEAPGTEAPPTSAPDTEAPDTKAPETEAPATNAPDTEAPETEAPETEAPPTYPPDTEAPLSRAPKTEAPESESPPVPAPSTDVPLPPAVPDCPVFHASDNVRFEFTDHHNNANACWDVRCASGAGHVHLLGMDTQHNRDFVSVGSAAFSGIKLPPQQSFGSSVRISFTSDASVSGGYFDALVSCVFDNS